MKSANANPSSTPSGPSSGPLPGEPVDSRSPSGPFPAGAAASTGVRRAGRVAVVTRGGRGWHALVLQIAGGASGGSGSGGSPRVLEHITEPSPAGSSTDASGSARTDARPQATAREASAAFNSTHDALAALLARIGSGMQVVHLLSPLETIVRPLTGVAPPSAAGTELAQSLALIAEAHLPESLPPHRRCAGVLRHGQARAMVAIGWPVLGAITAGVGTGAAHAQRHAGHEHWPSGTLHVPAPVAACALLRALCPMGGLVMVADDALDVLSMCASPPGTGGRSSTPASTDAPPPVIVRSVRELADEPDEWHAAARELAQDAGEALGCQFAVREVAPGLWTDAPASASSIAGVLAGLPPQLASACALQLGAALALTDLAEPEGGTSGLALSAALLTMSPRAPGADRPMIARAAAWLGSPGRAAAAFALALALLLGSFVGSAALAAWSTRRLLDRSNPDAKALDLALRQQAWQALLRERRWPQTHLLAQVVAALPEGVMIESITLEHGRPLQVAGTAPSAEVVSQLQVALAKDTTFTDVSVPTQNPASDGTESVRFTLNAKVADALAKVKPADGALPQVTTTPRARSAEGGERANAPDGAGGARATAESSPSATPARTGTGANANANRRTSTTRATPASPASGQPGTGAGAGTGAAGAATPKAPELPPVLTDAQIAGFTAVQARIEWAKRRGPSQNQALDEDVRARMEAEVNKLQARIDSLKAGGS